MLQDGQRQAWNPSIRQWLESMQKCKEEMTKCALAPQFRLDRARTANMNANYLAPMA
jgi:hypothetical protein